MKKYLYYLFVLLTIGCSQGESDERKDQIQVSDSAVVQDTNGQIEFQDTVLEVLSAPIDLRYLSYILPLEADVLLNYLGDTTIKRFDDVCVALAEAKLDTSLLVAFEELHDLSANLKQVIYENANYSKVVDGQEFPFYLQTELSFMEEAVPGFINSCEAECTEYDIAFDLSVYKEKAGKTEGELDDDFFDLLSFAHNEQLYLGSRFKIWFAQVGDYIGASLIGDKSHLKFLVKAKEYLSKSDYGIRFVNELMEDAFYDIFHGIYMYSPEEVVEELKEIIALTVFTVEQNKQLQEYIKKIESGDYSCECLGDKMQFNCETGECDFGG